MIVVIRLGMCREPATERPLRVSRVTVSKSARKTQNVSQKPMNCDHHEDMVTTTIVIFIWMV